MIHVLGGFSDGVEKMHGQPEAVSRKIFQRGKESGSGVSLCIGFWVNLSVDCNALSMSRSVIFVVGPVIGVCPDSGSDLSFGDCQ